MSTPVVSDSAGIKIVQNPAVAPHLSWRVLDPALIDVGGVAAEENDALFQIVGAVRLSDGRLAVANGGPGELRFYDTQGAFLQAAGRDGEGSGEFRTITWLGIRDGDSLIVFDTQLLRVSVFDGQGAFVRSYRLATTEAARWAQVRGMYADGSFLAQGSVDAGGVTPDGLQRYETSLYHVAADGTNLAEIGTFIGGEGFYMPFGNRGFSYYEPIFPRGSHRMAAEQHLYVGTNDTYEIRRYTPHGRLTGIVRRHHAVRAVTSDHVEYEHARRLARASDDRRERTEEALQKMPVPETFPAYHRVRGDIDGNLWVQAYPVPPQSTARWAVFDSTGVLQGEVDLPVDLDPTHIGEDFIVGVWRDDLEVEHLQLYALVKSD